MKTRHNLLLYALYIVITSSHLMYTFWYSLDKLYFWLKKCDFIHEFRLFKFQYKSVIRTIRVLVKKLQRTISWGIHARCLKYFETRGRFIPKSQDMHYRWERLWTCDFSRISFHVILFFLKHYIRFRDGSYDLSYDVFKLHVIWEIIWSD